MIKKYLPMFCLFAVLLVLLAFPAPIISATRTGVGAWADKIVPALFPFLVLTRLMVHYQVPQFLGKVLSPLFNKVLRISPITFFIILMGLLSGNPSGSKLAREYYDKQQISKQEFHGLLYFCNFASPLFILGTIGVILYDSQEIGYFLLMAHLLGSLAVFICIYPYFKNTTAIKSIEICFPDKSFSVLLIDAIESSIQTLVRIGGIIVFFFIVSEIFSLIQVVDALNYLLTPLREAARIPTIGPFFSGILEFTQGVVKISTGEFPFHLRLALTVFTISFAGLAVHTQVLMFAADAGISYLKYVGFRLMHAWASALIVLFTWSRFLPERTQDVFQPYFYREGTLLLVTTAPFTVGIIGFYFILKLTALPRLKSYRRPG